MYDAWDLSILATLDHLQGYAGNVGLEWGPVLVLEMSVGGSCRGLLM